VVDNVPLLAAAQNMYSLAQYPMDSQLWLLLAYTTGTGGSILIIGSAAGVAAMGMEDISFTWYLRRISVLALFGFLAGAVTFLALNG
jgi:Na+/H+ antiporter NhaD/arsenite permease-like protein